MTTGSPKAPPVTRWRYITQFDLPGEVNHAWQRWRIGVLSGFGDMDYRGMVVPHFHVSVSIPSENRRPNDDEMDVVRADFDMEDAEEDNHSPGVARHLFRPVHLPRGTVGLCECKEDEEIVTEPNGHQWSRKKELFTDD
jgi:hypothetical protein